jgi:hypothetical protein
VRKKLITLVGLLGVSACSTPVPVRDAGVDAFTSMVDTGESSPDAVTPVDTGTPVDAPGLDAPRECTMAGECAPAENATARCESNHCVYDCIDGFDDCDGALGCEQAIDVASHCGSCANDCGATGYCEGGSCGLGLSEGWFVRIRSPGPDARPRAVAVDEPRSRILVMGYVQNGSTLTSGSVTSTGAGGGSFDGYIASIDFGHTVQWVGTSAARVRTSSDRSRSPPTGTSSSAARTRWPSARSPQRAAGPMRWC